MAIGLKVVGYPADTALSATEVQACHDAATLDVTCDEVVQEWREDLKAHPIGEFSFSRHMPPLSTLDIPKLTPGNSRRQEAVSVYADIDEFTAYVARHIDDRPEHVVKALHVLRSELDRVLMSDFDGRRIRFIGDCVHGLLCDGTAQTTYEQTSVSTATLCAGALRSSFELALEVLDEEGVDVDGLGLAIGFELGPMTVTRLGVKGSRVRCSVSRGVLASETEQGRCAGTETAIGQAAYDVATAGVRKLFGSNRKVPNIDYNEAVEALAADGDAVAKLARSAAFAGVAPEIKRATASTNVLRPYADGR